MNIYENLTKYIKQNTTALEICEKQRNSKYPSPILMVNPPFESLKV